MSPKKRSVDVQKKEQSDQLVRYVSQLKGEIAVSSNILFIQAPQFLFNTVNLEVIREKGYYAYPPTGLQRLVTSLSGKNLNIKILDLNYLVIEKLIHDKSFD